MKVFFEIILSVILLTSTSNGQNIDVEDNPISLIPGGVADILPDENLIAKLTDKLGQLNGIQLTLVNLEKVTEQVVEGILYTYTGTFKEDNGVISRRVITLWERVWLDAPENLILNLVSQEDIPEEINTDKEPSESPQEEAPGAVGGGALGGKEMGMPGGVSKIPVDDNVVNMLKNNLSLLPEINLTLIRLIEVTQQVVAGVLYKYTGVFMDDSQRLSKCVISLWERQWLDAPDNLKIELISMEILNRRLKCINI